MKVIQNNIMKTDDYLKISGRDCLNSKKVLKEVVIGGVWKFKAKYTVHDSIL